MFAHSLTMPSFGLSSNVCAGVDFRVSHGAGDLIAWILAHAPAGEQSLIQIVAT